MRLGRPANQATLHFFWLCVAFFGALTFSYTGRLDRLDLVFYWGDTVARLLLPRLGWDTRCAVLLGGDSLPVRKPHPEPLLHAARQLGVEPADCVYVGDDERDTHVNSAGEDGRAIGNDAHGGGTHTERAEG